MTSTAVVVAEIVPLGVAVAASPFPVVPAILLLFTPRARANCLAFLTGWVLGVAGSTTVFVLVSTAVEQSDEPAAWASWARIVVGATLAVLGVRQWLGRHAKTDVPAWMRSIDGLEPRGSLRLGVVLSAANPKVLLLTAAAGLAIGAAELGTARAATATVVFTVLASVSVALPILLHSVLGDRVLEPLGRVRAWLQRNSAAVMAVVITAIGAVVLVKGLTGL